MAAAEGIDIHGRSGICSGCMLVKDKAKPRRALSGRRYDGSAVFLFSVTHPFRKRLINLVEGAWWDRCVLVAILTNCVTIALKDPLTPETPTWYAVSEWVFTAIFTFEMLVKILAMGATPFESTHCYLAEGWNCLDLLIVIASWINQLLADSSVSALRTFRVLRPLRTISRVRGMRILVRSLLESLPQLRDVLLLFSFFLAAAAILGVEIFRGRLHYRCFDATLGLSGEAGGVCTCPNLTAPDLVSTGQFGCSSFCGAGEECLYTPTNPNNGAIGFDNIFEALASIFQAVSLEGWSDMMHDLAVSASIASPLYFICLVVLGVSAPAARIYDAPPPPLPLLKCPTCRHRLCRC